jgi:hypothetical protein
MESNSSDLEGQKVACAIRPFSHLAAGKEKGRREEVPTFSFIGQRNALAASPGRWREEEPPAGYRLTAETGAPKKVTRP